MHSGQSWSPPARTQAASRYKGDLRNPAPPSHQGVSGVRGKELLGHWGEVWGRPIPEILCGLGRGAFLGPQLWKTTIIALLS